MDQIKRKSTLSQSSQAETKKIRNDLNQSITCIEHFSNECFYEIFDYLDCYKIHKAFSNLNYRFEQLINSSSLILKIKVHHSRSHRLSKNDYKQFLHLNKHKILSIQLSSESITNEFFSLFPIDSSLIRLESIFVRLEQLDTLLSFLSNSVDLPRLFSLTIDASIIHKTPTDIYRLVFLLPTLKSLKFILDAKDESISFPVATNQQWSRIEYLSMNYSFNLNVLSAILSYTPQLHRLNLLNNINIDTSIQRMLPITLSNLIDISITLTCVRFDEFEVFIRKICAKLKILRVCIHSEDITFLNANRWKKFILKSLPQLEEFYLQYSEPIDDEYEYPLYLGGVDQFASAFWIERQWIFEVEIIGESIKYLIRPYRKRWYEYTHSDEFSKSTRLITHIYPNEIDQLMIARVLTIAQIYHLEIPKEKVHIGALIESMNFFPELDTLKLHSLSIYDPTMLTSDELITLSSTDDTSQITKVYLEKMNEIKEFDFLLELCPYMEYLKVDYIKQMDFKFVLRYILKKIKDDSNDYLRELCFRIPTADDEMIKKFKRIIQFEKLLVNYTIQRVVDNVYIKKCLF